MFLVPSYNQPKLNLNDSWNPNATTFADSSTVGSNPCDIFVTTNNTIYTVNRESNSILIWFQTSPNVSKTISGNLSYPYGLFVTSTGDIFVDNGYAYDQVQKWTMNGTIDVPVMDVNNECLGLFVDINDNLYCSITNLHQVVAKSLTNSSSLVTVVAGTGCYGSASNMLYYPQRIFVDTNFSLYVADCGNNRIQYFQSGQFSGTTKAGNGTSGSLTLNCPTDVVLDADNYMFIVDSGNHRIIGSGSNGFRCIVGCSSSSGSTIDHLNYPQKMAFDSYGNIYVTDQNNNRIQKFNRNNNPFSKFFFVEAGNQLPVHFLIKTFPLVSRNSLDHAENYESPSKNDSFIIKRELH